jgi:serralysin
VDGKFSNFVDRSIAFTSIERFIFTLGSGNDNVAGGNATDNLNGGAGNDVLNGGNGNDVLTGGMGTDSLTGGGGADIFVYIDQAESGPGAARDKISDFVQGADRIDLSDLDADSTTPATEDFTFIGTAAFGSVAGQLRYTAAGGITVIEGDTDGNGLADFQIELTGEIPLQSTDFIF